VTPVARLAARAVNEGSDEVLLEAFVAAARLAAQAEELGDIRDGLIDMPLPFHAAERLGRDPDRLVQEALDQLDAREGDILLAFAGRPDRSDIEAMGYSESPGDAGTEYRWQ
jgi:hypothetical protein